MHAPVDGWRISRPGSDRALCGADVLRLFDQLRRRVARDRHGSEGVFLGYDELELALEHLGEGRGLRATARVVRSTGRLDTVAYVGTVVGSGSGRVHQVATACGVTAIAVTPSR
jgi:hypothetical protein